MRPLDAVALAHPLLESSALPLPPVVVATLAVLLLVAAFRLPARTGPSPRHGTVRGGLDEWRPAWAASRLVVLAVLAAATVAGRAGTGEATENIAPVLVVGVGWPLLVTGCLLVPRLWAWLDPWDTLARALDRASGSQHAPREHDAPLEQHAAQRPPAPDVTPAAAAAFAWVWFLGAYPATFAPRSVGAAVALYTLVTVAGCLLLGRVAWLGRIEAFGLLATWWGLLRRGRLTGWRPPPGVPAVLGVLAGGLLFSALRLSGVWFLVAHVAAATVAIAVACLAAAAVLHAADRLAERRGAPGAVAACAVPAVASVALAVALTNDRLWIAVQLLPAVIDDPLGRGWHLLGGIEPLVRASPLGPAGRVGAQIALLTAGHVLGARVARRRADRVSAGPALAALAAVLATGVLAVSAV